MRKHCMVLAIVLLGVTAIPAITQNAENAPNDAEQITPRRMMAISILRSINTVEIVYQSERGGFGSWEELLTTRNFGAETMKHLARLDPQLAGAQFSNGSEILPGWNLRLNVHIDEKGYDLFLEDTTDTNKGYAAFTDERAVIWECKPI
jgi:hypothetical protein